MACCVTMHAERGHESIASVHLTLLCKHVMLTKTPWPAVSNLAVSATILKPWGSQTVFTALLQARALLQSCNEVCVS